MDYSTEIPFEFHGDGKDYFRIWVVNLFLSVISLGIYSAWAKVRNNRYLYSHLHLDGSCFEYIANPKQILIGRVIAVVLLSISVIGSELFPLVGLWLLLPTALILPWMILKSLQFRARNSVYRNIRFGFHANYFEALLVIVVYPILAVVSIGLLSGFAIQRFYNFVVGHSSYGNTQFEFQSSIGEFYGFVFSVIFATLGMAILIGLIAAGAQFGLMSLDVPKQYFGLVIGAMGMVVYIWQFAYIKVKLTNLMYSGLTIPAWYTFTTSLKTWDLFKIYLVNTILILLSLGLYIPFARIKVMQYRVSSLRFVTTQSLDEFTFKNDPNVSAIGQEVGEMFDFGISL
tara:strand:+ start:240 stop:1268 length:1029 start_codon:yes stop_codon:yes gene_type:complete